MSMYYRNDTDKWYIDFGKDDVDKYYLDKGANSEISRKADKLTPPTNLLHVDYFFNSFWAMKLQEFKIESENIKANGRPAFFILDNTVEFIEVPDEYLKRTMSQTKLLKSSFTLQDSPGKCPLGVSKCLTSEKDCSEFYDSTKFV